MNKTELIASVAQKSDLTKKDAEKAVQIIGFGTFEVRQRKARTGRNPQTKEAITIEASSTPAFKAGKQLKDLVNNK